jgi:hypothetical protein
MTMAKLQTKTGRHISVWTKEKIAEFKKIYPSLTEPELAKEFNVTYRSIRGLVTKLGLKKRNRGWTKKEEAYLLKNWSTHTKQELAAHFKKTRSAINRRYKALEN